MRLLRKTNKNRAILYVWISDTEGFDISVTWSEGVWLKNDGSMYYGDIDFPALWEELEGEDEDSTLSVLSFPNAGRLARYHLLFMQKSEELVPDSKGGVSMTVEQVSDSEIVVEIHNGSQDDFIYGEYYSLQKKVDSDWYTMPVLEDNIAFPAIAITLPAGESIKKTYDLGLFGPLEEGTYKLVVEQMGVEFGL